MIPAKTFYLLYYGAMASLAPFLALYYRQIGLTGRQIGALEGLGPLITLVSAPLWGGLADASRAHKRLLLLAMLGLLGSTYAMLHASAFLHLLPVVMLRALFGAPIMPLVDNAVLNMLGPRKERYGRQRLWGAVGWGLAAPVVGSVVERLGLHAAFYAFFALVGCGLLAGGWLPIRAVGLGKPFWQGLRLLLMNRGWALFLIVVFLQMIGRASTHGFLYLHLSDLGASATLIGLSLTVASVSELPMYFFSDVFLRRWGPRGLLILSAVATIITLFAYAAMRAPWVVLVVQLLHGPSFSAMWVAGVSYAHASAPKGMGATAQGLFSSVAGGLGSALGVTAAGMLYDQVGATGMFRWAGAVVALGLGLFVLGGGATRPASRDA